MPQNTKIIYKCVPSGLPDVSRDFDTVKEEIDFDQVNLDDSQLLVQNLWISVDPYIRGRMRDPSIESYFPIMELNKPMTSGAICKVVKSADTKFKSGDILTTMSEWANYSVVDSKKCIIIKNKYNCPLHYYLSVLGMPGITAYAGLNRIGKPKPGETIFISGASGAVGQVVGQLAKIYGLKTVGSAGDDAKVKLLKENLGYEAAFNYKTVDNLSSTLKELCPNGIDIYFDNVGGETLDIALAHCNDHARVPLCGMISQYNSGKDLYGVKNLGLAVSRRMHLEGFIASDEYKQYGAKFIEDMEEYVHQGKVKSVESIEEGVENIPKAFLNLFRGANLGKQVVKVSDDA